jgi:hypothetical protein
MFPAELHVFRSGYWATKKQVMMMKVLEKHTYTALLFARKGKRKL